MGPRLTLSGSAGSSPFPLLGARNRTRLMVDGGWDGAFPMEDKEQRLRAGEPFGRLSFPGSIPLVATTATF